MEELRPEIIVTIFDSMIIRPQDFLNIFLINKHWRQHTELNTMFWKRQLAGIFMFLSNIDRNGCPVVDHVYISGVKTQVKYDLECVYQKFFDLESLKALTQSNSVLRSLHLPFASLFHTLQRQHGEELDHDFVVVKNFFLETFFGVTKKKNNHYIRLVLGLVEEGNDVFNWSKTGIYNCEYFYEDEIEKNEQILGGDSALTSLLVSNLVPYWSYIGSIKTEHTERVKALQDKILNRYLLPKDEFVKLFTRLLCATLERIPIDEGEEVIEKKIQPLMDVFPKYFNRIEKTKRCGEFEKLILSFFYSSLSCDNPSLVIHVLERIKQALSSIYEQSRTLQYHRSLMRLYNGSIEDKSLKTVEYLCNNYKINSEAIFVWSDLNFYQIFKIYYNSSGAILDVGDRRLWRILDLEDEEEMFSAIDIYQHFLERNGKDKKEFFKEMCKTGAVFEIFRIRISGLDEEKFKTKLRIAKRLMSLISNHLPKDHYLPNLKRSLRRRWNCAAGLDYVDYLSRLVQFCYEEYKITPSQCSEVTTVDYLSMRDYFTDIELEEARENANKVKSKEVGKDTDNISIHPAVEMLLKARTNPDNLSFVEKVYKDKFLSQYWKDTVQIPILIDCEYPTPINFGPIYRDDDGVRFCIAKEKLSKVFTSTIKNMGRIKK